MRQGQGWEQCVALKWRGPTERKHLALQLCCCCAHTHTALSWYSHYEHLQGKLGSSRGKTSKAVHRASRYCPIEPCIQAYACGRRACEHVSIDGHGRLLPEDEKRRRCHMSANTNPGPVDHACCIHCAYACVQVVLRMCMCFCMCV